MSLYTAAVLLCVFSLAAATRDLAGVREDLTTAPSTRTLLAKRNNKEKSDSSTVVTLDLDVNEGTVTVASNKRGGKAPSSSRRGLKPRNPPPVYTRTGRTSTTTTDSFSYPRRGPIRSPLRPRGRGGFFSSGFGGPVPSRGPAAGPSSAFEYYDERGDVDLNKVTTVVTKSVVYQKELPLGEKNLDHHSYESASKGTSTYGTTKKPVSVYGETDLNSDGYESASKSPSFGDLTTKRPVSKPVGKASASTSFSGSGQVVETSSRVRVGRKGRKSANTGNGRPRRSPRRSRSSRG